MSQQVLETPAPIEETKPAPVNIKGANFARIVAAEFRKFATLRSNWILLAVAGVVTVGFALLGGWSLVLFKDTMMDQPDMQGQAEADVNAMLADEGLHGTIGMSGLQLGVILLGVLAVLAMSSEHGTGAIRSSLLAAPQRLGLLAAKAITMSVIVGATTFLLMLISHYAVYGFVEELGAATSFFDEDTIWQYGVATLFSIAVAWLGVGIGALLRNNAGGIVTLFVLTLILPMIWMAFPEGWLADIGNNYLMMNLAQRAMDLTEEGSDIPRAAAIAGFFAWGLAGLIAGGVRLQNSDVK